MWASSILLSSEMVSSIMIGPYLVPFWKIWWNFPLVTPVWKAFSLFCFDGPSVPWLIAPPSVVNINAMVSGRVVCRLACLSLWKVPEGLLCLHVYHPIESSRHALLPLHSRQVGSFFPPTEPDLEDAFKIHIQLKRNIESESTLTNGYQNVQRKGKFHEVHLGKHIN